MPFDKELYLQETALVTLYSCHAYYEEKTITSKRMEVKMTTVVFSRSIWLYVEFLGRIVQQILRMYSPAGILGNS